MQQVFAMLQRVFPGETRILIGGESGTGKELIARTIHYNGPRKDKNFVAIDCGALPENLLESELFGHVKGAFTGAIRDKKGLFEIADGGTLFLDEVANTSLQFQARLLRAIQEGEFKPVGATGTKKVDVRVIAATSSDLQQKIAAGEFREDLFYRLNVLFINLPPLRERREDIRLLSEHFLKNFATKTRKNCRLLTKETLGLLENYTWPGNIRELENVIERAVALALPEDTSIIPELLPQHITGEPPEVSLAATQSGGQLNDAVDFLERRLISEALAKCDGNRTEAAKALGTTRQTLLAKIKKYGL
jgi:transcriptional regulator with PAS, ATPase and Fis domain